MKEKDQTLEKELKQNVIKQSIEVKPNGHKDTHQTWEKSRWTQGEL